MGPTPDAVATDTELPPRAAVVIVGGGIIGVSAALFLSQRRVPVVLCEKGRIAGEQSSRNWGWVRKMGRDPRELPLIIESLRIWNGINQLVGAETGFRACGIAYLCHSEQEEAGRAAWLDYARQYQLDTRMIGPEEIARLLPGSAQRYRSALYTPSDGRAEPQKAAPAIAAAARGLGAVILEQCAVRGIETKAGKVAAALTQKGRIECDAVLLAGGAWSRLFCGNLGLNLPQLKVRSSVLRTEPLQGAPETTASGPGFAFRKRLDGGYTIGNFYASAAEIVPDSFRLLWDFLPLLRSERRHFRLRLSRRFIEEWRTPRRFPPDRASPFEAAPTLDPEPIVPVNDRALSALRRAFPVFEQARIAQHWAGMVDVTPDAVPVISPIAALPGFFVATGFSGHGFGIGPGAGRLAADLITGDPPLVDPAPFRFERFRDGSRPRPLAGL